MSAMSIKIVREIDNNEYAQYIIGRPPRRIVGQIRVYKSDGRIELICINEDNFRKYLKYVETLLTEYFNNSDYPEEGYYSA